VAEAVAAGRRYILRGGIVVLAQLRSSLTYANVMATVAFFVAIGGTSYAVATGSIDSREIKNNTVRSKDVRNRSLLARDFKADQLPRGPSGATGATGATGAPGDPGTARAYARVSTFVGTCTLGPAADECPLFKAKGITKVTRVDVGLYCVTAPGIDADDVPAAVAVDYGTPAPKGNASVMLWSGSDPTCPNPDTDFVVGTERQLATTVNQGGGTNNVSVAGNSVERENIPFEIVIP